MSSLRIKISLQIFKTCQFNFLKISPKHALSWCNSFKNMAYFETSVKEAINVDQAFATVAKSSLARDKERKLLYDDIPISIKSISSQEDNTENQQKYRFCGC